jgi:tetratricopeptide (TPR) repeat protein
MRQSTSIRLLIFFAVCVAFAVRATPIPEIVAKAKPAVVQVIASDGNWSPIRTGTGFFVSADGELLTNFHVIQGATHISARTNKGSIFVFEKVIAQSADSDVALLKFQATDVDFLKLGNSTDAAEGETVLVIGNPEGLQGTVSNGIISAFRENRSYIQITAPISPGSSGSPVLDETGEVIGMATLVSKEGQNLNFAISAEIITSVIHAGLAQTSPAAKPGFPSPTPNENLASSYYSKALSESRERNYAEAIDDFVKAVQTKPDFADAYFGLGNAYESLGRHREAIAAYTELIRLQADSPEAFIERGAAYQWISPPEFQKAIADFAEAIRLRPNSEDGYFRRAIVYAGPLRQPAKAIVDYTKVLLLKPDDWFARQYRAEVYDNIGEYLLAIALSSTWPQNSNRRFDLLGLAPLPKFSRWPHPLIVKCPIATSPNAD